LPVGAPKGEDIVTAVESGQRTVPSGPHGDFSPDQTNQFTILKAKLFNPMLNPQGVLKEEISQTTSNGSVLAHTNLNNLGHTGSGLHSGHHTMSGGNRGL